MSDIHFQGFWRMDWGLGNPNKTAALIATLMIAVWIFAYIRKWGFWVALSLFTGLGICLIHTYSRGGLIAAAAGCCILLWWAPRPWDSRKICITVASLWIMIGASIYLQANNRYGQGIIKEDRSITNRLELWEAGLHMIYAAPFGWGAGQSGAAFIQWYQDLNRSEDYRTLVNSHLTWLVELGWLGRFLYLLGWFIIFVFCYPTRKSSWLAIPFGIWVAFFIAAWFSSVGESSWLWIVPGLGLVSVLGYHIFRKEWTGFLIWQPPVFAVLACLIIWIAGWNNTPLLRTDHYIKVGSGSPKIWLVTDPKVIGQNPGRALRQFFQKNRKQYDTIQMVDSLDLIPDGTKEPIIITGSRTPSELKRLSQLIQSSQKITLISPTFYPEEISSPAQLQALKVIIGEFSQSPSSGVWKETLHLAPTPGMADYLATWPEVVFNASQD